MLRIERHRKWYKDEIFLAMTDTRSQSILSIKEMETSGKITRLWFHLVSAAILGLPRGTVSSYLICMNSLLEVLSVEHLGFVISYQTGWDVILGVDYG